MPIVGPTNYVHPYPNYQLNDLHQAMDYNAAGQPIIRTSGGLTSNLAIASGQIDGMSYVFKTGYNSNFANNTEESYWGDSTIYPWSAWNTPGTLSVVSSDSDTGDILIQGVDENFEFVEETVTLTGTTPVVTSATFARINYMHYMSATGTNAGYLTASRGGTVVGYVDVGFGVAQMAQYTVPAGYTAYIMQGTANIGKGNDGTGKFKYRPYGSSFQTAMMFTLFQSTFSYQFSIPLMLPEKTDIDVTLTASTSGVASSCAYDILLVQNQPT